MFSYGFWLVAGWGREDIVGGLVFVVLMFIGAGVGLLFERPAAGRTIGMGLGFLAMAYLRAIASALGMGAV